MMWKNDYESFGSNSLKTLSRLVGLLQVHIRNPLYLVTQDNTIRDEIDHMMVMIENNKKIEALPAPNDADLGQKFKRVWSLKSQRRFMKKNIPLPDSKINPEKPMLLGRPPQQTDSIMSTYKTKSGDPMP